MAGADGLVFATARARVERYRDPVQRRALAADPDVRRFSHWPDADEAAFAASIAAMRDRSPLDGQGWMNLAIVLTGGSYAGDHAMLVQGTAAMLGIALAPAMRGTGLGQEVIAGSLAWLRRHGVHRFLAEIDPDNQASLALFGRAGFRPAGLDRDELGPFWRLECA